LFRRNNREIGYEFESPLDNAVHQVFDCLGDDVEFERGILWGTAEALERVKQRAGVRTMSDSPFAYTSRSGKMHFPFDYALELARKFCASEPFANSSSLRSILAPPPTPLFQAFLRLKADGVRGLIAEKATRLPAKELCQGRMVFRASGTFGFGGFDNTRMARRERDGSAYTPQGAGSTTFSSSRAVVTLWSSSLKI